MANEPNETFTVLRLRFDALRPKALWETPESVKIIADAPTNLEALTAAFAAVRTESAPPSFHEDEALSAVAIGPVLDSPDKVQLHDLTRADGQLTLRIDYTRIRMMDVTLPRSLPWRPMLIARVPALTQGRYDLEAVWRAISAIPGGYPLQVADLHESFPFDIVN